jgi:hypothetical protein
MDLVYDLVLTLKIDYYYYNFILKKVKIYITILILNVKIYVTIFFCGYPMTRMSSYLFNSHESIPLKNFTINVLNLQQR